MQRPHNADCDARVRMVGQKKGDTHERRDREHDAQLLCDRHAASPVSHEDHGLTIDLCRAQPCIHAARAARKAERGEQNEGDGRQDRQKRAEDAETETDEPEQDKEKFFEYHRFPSKI